MQPSTEALQFAKRLKANGVRFVLAESCTAGLVSATLGSIPGISEWMCGSAVTYREQTKIQWLDISPSDLHQYTAESAEVTLEMVTGVLEHTPEATLAAAVTGHLGPGAPPEIDGIIFVAVGVRLAGGSVNVNEWRITLSTESRGDRQDEATRNVIRHMTSALEQAPN